MSGESPMAEESVNQKDLETMTRGAPVSEPDGGAPADSGPADQIRLTGVGGIGHHGVLEEERRDGQPFLADLVLTVDTRAAATGDDLTRTVNYAEVAQQVVAVIEGEPVNLIETLAARIAAVVLTHQGVHAVTVTVHKPEAPVGVPFTDVEVTITRTPADDLPHVEAGPAEQVAPPEPATPLPPTVLPPATAAEPAAAPAEAAHSAPGPDLHATPEHPVPVVVALGGNVGDVRATLRAVVADLRALPGLSVEEVSPLARTAAVLAPDAVAQPDYLNAVVLATTALAPMALLESMQGLENAYGRRRTERWGERSLDLDLIVYDGVSSTDPELSLPHPRASERAFVLVPWAQAAPDAFLPGLGGGPVATLAETAPDRGGVRWLALDWLEEPVRPGPAPQPAAGAPAANADGESAAVAPAEIRPEGQEAGVGALADEASAEPAAPAAGPDSVSDPDPADGSAAAVGPDPAAQWAPDDEQSWVSQAGLESQESQEDLELLAHGDAEPEAPAPAPPVVPPAGRPGRASFPPPAEPAAPPPASAVEAEPAPWPGPTAEPAASPEASVEPQPQPQAEPEPEEQPEPQPEPEPEEQPQPQAEEEQRSWFDDGPPDAGGQNEPSLPWVTSPEEGRAPRPMPKWQPLRRDNDT